jgi:hypothetical protein
MIIDPDHPDLELVSDAVCLAYIVGPDGPSETEFRGVSEFYRIFLCIERASCADISR